MTKISKDDKMSEEKNDGIKKTSFTKTSCEQLLGFQIEKFEAL